MSDDFSIQYEDSGFLRKTVRFAATGNRADVLDLFAKFWEAHVGTKPTSIVDNLMKLLARKKP